MIFLYGELRIIWRPRKKIFQKKFPKKISKNKFQKNSVIINFQKYSRKIPKKYSKKKFQKRFRKKRRHYKFPKTNSKKNIPTKNFQKTIPKNGVIRNLDHDYRKAWRVEGSDAKKAMDKVTGNLIPFMVTWLGQQKFHYPNPNQDAAW
mgnify:CR=1 FL=1